MATLALSLFAFQIAKRKANLKYTYGYHKSTILAALANAVILLIAVGSVGWEATQRFVHPEHSEGKTISLVAGIGIIVNSVSAYLLFNGRYKDLNVKGAYLHLATDALVSAGVVIAGFIISYTGFLWIDPLITLLIMAVVLYSAWGLLLESIKLSIDAVPANIGVENVKMQLEKIKGVHKIHHVHIWALSTTSNALTAHIVLETGLSEKDVEILKKRVRHELEHHNIQHATLETEPKSGP